jgi:hypothetical protein
MHAIFDLARHHILSGVDDVLQDCDHVVKMNFFVAQRKRLLSPFKETQQVGWVSPNCSAMKKSERR